MKFISFAKWRGFFIAFAIATATALGIRAFLIEDFRISSNSMAPNLLSGDLVFASKLSYNIRLPFSSFELIRIRKPQVGEIVAFSLPNRGLSTFVKRVVATEGQTVQITNGVLYVNGAPAHYEPLPEGAPKSAPIVYSEVIPNAPARTVQFIKENVRDFGPIDVPKGHFFALGDNRAESIDSRAWGPVSYSCLKGRVKFIWISLSSSGNVRANRVGMFAK